MPKTMNVSLPPDLMDFVARKLSEGGFHNQSEIIRAGLRLLKASEDQSQRLHTALAIGIADMEAGRTKPLTDELLADIAERGRQRSAEGNSGGA